ncbi:PAS domain S-box protein [uncultured Limimaricola sp.]|uniref:PAS domain S-box protein n=1 Tax=uncultured Limimaricola sp. TaxID=2211667 RepID=UPI0030F7953B
MTNTDFLDGLGLGAPSQIDWPGVFDRLHEGLVIAEVFREANGQINWRYLHVNEAWSNLTGLSAVGIVGKNVSEVIPNVEQHWIDDFARVALDQQSRNFVGPVSQLGRTYDIRAFPVAADRFGLLFLDVTEREESEARLKRRTEELEIQIRAEFGARARTWDVSPDIQVVANRDGHFEQANPAMLSTLGYDMIELTQIPFIDLVHPDDRDSTIAAFEKVRQDQPILRFENRYRHADGSYRWLSWVAVPHGGKVYSTARDVTEEKQQAAELEMRRAERSNLWSASRDLHAIVALDGRFIELSDAWNGQLGFDPEDLPGTRFEALAFEDDRTVIEELLQQLATTGSADHVEMRMRDRSGALRWFGWSAVVRGDVIFATGRNLDERRRQEEQLRLAEEALTQSRKLETLGQLTGGVAHDFNNLLAAIQSSLSMLRQHIDADNAKAVALLGNAQSGADRGAKLVQHMLAFARRQDLAPTCIDACTLIGEMDQLLRSSLGPGIEIRRHFEENVPAALVDANQLEMAVLNLAVNARDAMDGQGTLTISCAMLEHPGDPDLAPGRYVQLAVADDGPGMDATTLARATEPFFTTKGVGKGTGLGLSMVHGLARQSGGAFRLESTPGFGVTAEILLPVATPSRQDKPVELPTKETSTTTLDRPLKILAVDDDFLVMMGTVGMLEDLGHEVLEAGRGEEALAIFEAHPDIDLVLTDQAMPGMTGAQLAEILRHRRPDLPILLCTGYGELPAGSEHFMTGRLGKPFSERQLAEAIRGSVAQNG